MAALVHWVGRFGLERIGQYLLSSVAPVELLACPLTDMKRAAESCSLDCRWLPRKWTLASGNRFDGVEWPVHSTPAAVGKYSWP